MPLLYRCGNCGALILECTHLPLPAPNELITRRCPFCGKPLERKAVEVRIRWSSS